MKELHMSFNEFPSRLLENAVNEFASLPGVGRKTAFQARDEFAQKGSGRGEKALVKAS